MSLLEVVEDIGRQVALPNAASVDVEARFPKEVFDALKEKGLLSAMVPTDLGGNGASVSEIAACISALSKYCASSAMIFAMHQIQVACLVRHGTTEYFQSVQRDLVKNQYLLASATTELGVGGDVRTSKCAVEIEGERFRLEKMAPVISYAENADAILVTARRGPDSPPSDQVIVLVEVADSELEPLSGWDTLGFRGTCSLGFKLKTSGRKDAILPEPYGDISSQTMLPISHIVWSSVWLGIATAAMLKAQKFVQAEARSKPGTTPPSAMRMAELFARYSQFADTVKAGTDRFEAMSSDRESLTSVGFALSMNAMKINSSNLVVEVVSDAMNLVGISGYREDSDFTMGRLLRDAHGASLMVNNDRIHLNNSQLLLVHRDF